MGGRERLAVRSSGWVLFLPHAMLKQKEKAGAAYVVFCEAVSISFFMLHKKVYHSKYKGGRTNWIKRQC